MSAALAWRPYVASRDERETGPRAPQADIARQKSLERQFEAKALPTPQSTADKAIDDPDSTFFPIPEFRPLPSGKEQVFAAAKEWEGYVQEVGNSHFIAELREVRPRPNDEVDMAEIPIGDIPAKDRELLREGAVFRYLVGYAMNSHRQVTRRRHVYFRRGRVRADGNVEALWLETAAMFRPSEDMFINE